MNQENMNNVGNSTFVATQFISSAAHDHGYATIKNYAGDFPIASPRCRSASEVIRGSDAPPPAVKRSYSFSLSSAQKSKEPTLFEQQQQHQETSSTRRRQFVCTFPGCRNPRPNKKSNIEKHVWSQHVRHRFKGLDQAAYQAKLYKVHVERWVAPVTGSTNSSTQSTPLSSPKQLGAPLRVLSISGKEKNGASTSSSSSSSASRKNTTAAPRVASSAMAAAGSTSASSVQQYKSSTNVTMDKAFNGGDGYGRKRRGRPPQQKEEKQRGKENFTKLDAAKILTTLCVLTSRQYLIPTQHNSVNVNPMERRTEIH